VIEELAEFGELLFAYVLETECDLDEGLDFTQRPASHRDMICVFATVRTTIALRYVRGDSL